MKDPSFASPCIHRSSTAGWLPSNVHQAKGGWEGLYAPLCSLVEYYYYLEMFHCEKTIAVAIDTEAISVTQTLGSPQPGDNPRLSSAHPRMGVVDQSDTQCGLSL